MKKYTIKIGDAPATEVSKEEFMKMEQFCGFYPKDEGETSTSSFGIIKNGLEISGKTSE